MMQNNDFDSFFAGKGILTNYNGLGATDECFQYYVDATVEKLYKSNQFRSNYLKQECYKLFYPNLSPRAKKTGFESFYDLEKQKKDSMIDSTSIDVFADRFSYSYNGSNLASPSDFKKAISKHYSQFDGDIILYLSGGVDSELLARILLEYNIKFTPILFEWLNKDNTVQNADEAKNAYEFCAKYKLELTSIKINLIDLWESEEFRHLAQATRFSSMQVVTHSYMVHKGETMFPNSLHVFGGEVRYTLPEEQENVLLYASKTCINSLSTETLGTGTPQPDTATFIEGGLGYNGEFPFLRYTGFLYLSGGNQLVREINGNYNSLEGRDGEPPGMNFWYNEYYKITQQQGVSFNPDSLDPGASAELEIRMSNASTNTFDAAADKCTLRSQGWDI